MGSFEGIGVPLYGAFTRYTDASTPVETLSVGNLGTFFVTATSDSSGDPAVAVGGPNGWLTGDDMFHTAGYFQMTSTMEGTGRSVNCALVAELHNDASLTGGQQNFAMAVYLHNGSSASCAGGAEAALLIAIEETSGYTPAADSAYSYIQFTTCDAEVPRLFRFQCGAADTAGGYLETLSNPNTTHGLAIDINGTRYWILVADSSAA